MLVALWLYVLSIKPGVTTDDIDKAVHEMVIVEDAYPSPLNYHSFPKSICTSVNEVVAHGIPDSRALLDGDIVSIDITVYFNGYHGDCCETFFVGNSVNNTARNLVSVARECLYKGISVCGPGVDFWKIGEAIEPFVQEHGFNVVAELMGHGVGELFHTFPFILHVRNRESGKMKPGMVFTIEPVITEGCTKIDVWPDKWTIVTTDGSWSAQFEHTVVITDTGVEILTESEAFAAFAK